MGWLCDPVEDGDAFEGCHERICACADYCRAPDTFGVWTLLVFLLALTSRRLEERDSTVQQSLHPSDTVHTPEQRWTRRVPATVVLARIVKLSQVLGSMRNETLKVRVPFTYFCFLTACLSHLKVLCLDALFQPTQRFSAPSLGE